MTVPFSKDSPVNRFKYILHSCHELGGDAEFNTSTMRVYLRTRNGSYTIDTNRLQDPPYGWESEKSNRKVTVLRGVHRIKDYSRQSGNIRWPVFLVKAGSDHDDQNIISVPMIEIADGTRQDSPDLDLALSTINDDLEWMRSCMGPILLGI